MSAAFSRKQHFLQLAGEPIAKTSAKYFPSSEVSGVAFVPVRGTSVQILC